ncbi:hypothetical protein H7B90_23525 [Cohnella xylanilytica]|uniref:Bro-N domain-containing protein n=1 Tax=Cohnella xylanilytica TaxID=557555 RepID=A0A841U8M6_9BACL|nr:BRO family protein [Cohnella xylanilytica]MBB6694371.1 hypothetical protein [Cohnella xylanilytica]
MDNQLMMFEGSHEVMILLQSDVDFDFKGEFLIRAKDIAHVLEYQGSSATQEVLKFTKEDQVFIVRNSNMVNRHIRLHNTGETFVTNLALNRILGKSEKPKAESFQDWLYEDILPSVQKNGRYEVGSGHNSGRYRSWLKQAEDHIKFAKLLSTTAGVKPGIALAAAISEAEKETGVSLDVYKKLLPAADHETGILTPTLIAEKTGMKSGIAVNKLLEELGLQYIEKTIRKSKSTGKDKEVKTWRLTEEGKKYGEEFPFVRNGHSGYQIKWSEDVLELIQRKSA